MALGHVDPMASFFAEKEDLERLLQGLARETARILQLADDEGRGTSTSRACAGTDLQEDSHRGVSALGRCIRSGQAYATKLQTALGKMKAENERIQRAHGEEDRLYVIRKMHYNRLLREFMDAMRRHQEAKSDLSEANKSALLRRARIVLPGESDAELTRRLNEDPEGFVARELLGVAPSDVVLTAYSEVQARAREVRELSASIQEVYDMFRDLHFLLSVDQREVEEAEEKVVEAAGRVHKADAQLEKAVVRRENRCCVQ